jgi:hypothetical protein
MGAFDYFRDRLLDRLTDWMLPADFVARRKVLTGYRDYRAGRQVKQLHNKPSSPDDNIVMNFTGLVIDRSVSMLFGKGIHFDYESDTTEEYLDKVWDANRKELLLHKIGVTGAESGTWYCKIIPEGKEYQGELVPRLVVLDPLLMTIETKPDDIETVLAYNITYMVKRDNKDEVFQEHTSIQDNGQWLIESGIIKNNKFQAEKKEVWEWEFPPIIHGQNLPSVETVYGDPDVTPDVVELQDRLNLTSSNISKILRLHAHPILIGEGFGGSGNIDIEPGKLMQTTEGQKVYAVEMQSDLASSQSYMMVMRQALFDVTRTVDISSMSDKLGALTNFGLRVLYQDSLAKNETKKQLYGDSLLELNRRLLALNGIEPEEGHIEWPEPLPENVTEEIAGLTFDLQNGLVSKETVSGLRGYEAVSEQEKINIEKSQGDNIGAALLANFARGGQ